MVTSFYSKMLIVYRDIFDIQIWIGLTPSIRHDEFVDLFQILPAES
jgi:hypothetical protein